MMLFRSEWLKDNLTGKLTPGVKEFAPVGGVWIRSNAERLIKPSREESGADN
jgi:hypothetical protein